MAWVHLKRWMEVYSKRKRRDWKLSALLAQMSGMGSLGAMFGGSSAPQSEEISDEERVRRLQLMGIAVERPKVD